MDTFIVTDYKGLLVVKIPDNYKEIVREYFHNKLRTVTGLGLIYPLEQENKLSARGKKWATLDYPESYVGVEEGEDVSEYLRSDYKGFPKIDL